jgi:hypothetical protein
MLATNITTPATAMRPSGADEQDEGTWTGIKRMGPKGQESRLQPGELERAEKMDPSPPWRQEMQSFSR